MDDGELNIGGRGVRVGVDIGRLTVGSPARVGDTKMAGELLLEIKALLERPLAQDRDLLSEMRYITREKGRRYVETSATATKL